MAAEQVGAFKYPTHPGFWLLYSSSCLWTPKAPKAVFLGCELDSIKCAVLVRVLYSCPLKPSQVLFSFGSFSDACTGRASYSLYNYHNTQLLTLRLTKSSWHFVNMTKTQSLSSSNSLYLFSIANSSEL